MALKSSNNKNSNRVEQPQIESDVYPSYVVQIIDLGLQPQRAFQGQEKAPCPEIMLTYELSDVFMVDENGVEQEDKPRLLSETLPFYGLFADKAKSTKRYLALDPDEIHEGDFSKLVGLPCNVTVVLNKVGDKIYTNIGNVAPIAARKAAAMPEIKNPTKVFDLDLPDLEIFNSLPEWVKTKIKSNLNFAGSPLDKLLKGGNVKPAAKQENVSTAPQIAPVDD